MKEDSTEVDKRIELAAAEGRRAKETHEFLSSLTKNDEILKPIRNPEAFVLRDKAKAAAKRGDVPRTKCNHPFSSLNQYIDEDPLARRHGQALNLFECGICHLLLWLVDPWGDDKLDS